MKFVLRSLALFVCLVVPASSFAAPGIPLPRPVCPPSPPVMDGRLGAHEWDAARQIDIQVNLPEGGTAPARLYLMNDSRSLYVALRVQRTAVDAASTFSVFLDSNGDGTTSPGDDGFLLSHDFYGGDTLGDHVYFEGDNCPAGALCTASDVDRHGSNDTSGAFGQDATSITYELTKPLSTSDPNDGYLEEGMTIPMSFSLRLIAPDAEWPNGFGDTYYPSVPSSGVYVAYAIRACY